VPPSLDSARAIHQALRACGIRLVATLPETWLVPLVRYLEEDPSVTVVHLLREDEGLAIAAGAELAGTRSAVLMQNHGMLASVNAIVSCAQLYRIPLLLLISQRGEFGERDPWQTEGGLVTEPVLDALRIPVRRVTHRDDVAAAITDANALARASSRPVAVLLERRLLWEDAA
jgi:sulfopyruvate decarboxylase subunit alpha